MAEDALFDHIAQRTLRAEVVDRIRQAIVSGRLAPGARLRETAIAEQMSVSRSPVREALRQLEQEGLVTISPNQGARVRVFVERDIREIFTLRAALETLACEVVLTNGGAQLEDLACIEAFLKAQKVAIRECDYDYLTELDMEFHQSICELAGFERLLKMWRSLRSQMEVLFNQRFRARPDYVPLTVETDHAQIVDAIRDADLPALARLHREINERVARECIEIIWHRGGGQRAG